MLEDIAAGDGPPLLPQNAQHGIQHCEARLKSLRYDQHQLLGFLAEPSTHPHAATPEKLAQLLAETRRDLARYTALLADYKRLHEIRN